MKEEALKLADKAESLAIELPADWSSGEPKNVMTDISAMIRKLVEELDKPHKYDPETGEPLIDGYPLFSGLPRVKPLSEKELYEIFDKCYPNNGDGDVVTLVDFARAIEERHGIK